ncbi:MAG: thermonuclease family protein [Candidatus Omnitrophota bacterium]
MKRHLKLTFITAALIATGLILLAAGCQGEAELSENNGLYRSRQVIDGDTIELSSGQRVRYIGIDTPEIRKKEGEKWVYRPEVYGVEAKNRNASLVSGKALKLEFDVEKEDRYGRYLAYVYSGDAMVNSLLVREGFATVYTFPPNVKHYKELVMDQQEAFVLRRGLWGTLREIRPSQAHLHGGDFCLISGRISGQDISSGKMYLYLASAEPDTLRLVIYLRNLPLFEAEGVDPFKDYKGREIEVFGKVNTEGSHPEVMVDNPFQIKVLQKPQSGAHGPDA